MYKYSLCTADRMYIKEHSVTIVIVVRVIKLKSNNYDASEYLILIGFEKKNRVLNCKLLTESS